MFLRPLLLISLLAYSLPDDPVIEKIAVENGSVEADGVSHVYATDTILAHLMASPRSVYPWDIVVQVTPQVVKDDSLANSSRIRNCTGTALPNMHAHAYAFIIQYLILP